MSVWRILLYADLFKLLKIAIPLVRRVVHFFKKRCLIQHNNNEMSTATQNETLS